MDEIKNENNKNLKRKEKRKLQKKERIKQKRQDIYYRAQPIIEQNILSIV